MHNHNHDDDVDPEADAVCLIGGHRHPGDGNICTRHLEQIRRDLTGIARMTQALPHLLVPGSAAAGDKVSTSRVGSPTNARLDVLSLIAPGGAEIRRDARMLSPLVRRWATARSYEVHTVVDGEPVTHTRTVYDWHAELVTDGPRRAVECSCNRQHVDRDGRTVTRARPVLVLDDDQTGSIPPAEWLDMWVRRWRIALHHTTSPIRGRVDLACDADQRRRVERARIGESLRAARRSPALMPAVAQLIGFQRALEQHLAAAAPRIRMSLLGVRYDGPAHQARVDAALDAGRLPAGGDLTGATFEPVADAVATEWGLRYGYAGVAAAVEVDARYLAEWVELAADHHDPTTVDLALFAGELRSLHRELEHVMGEIGDEMWLGRCPAFLRDTDGEETDRRCGAGLWQDPYRTRVECPRCHTAWPQADWLRLAAMIRTAWPIDRRRRYLQGDKAAAEKAIRDAAGANPHAYRCRGCEQILAVDWTEVTGRRDRTRAWSPSRLVCPGGCIAGSVSVAA